MFRIKHRIDLKQQNPRESAPLRLCRRKQDEGNVLQELVGPRPNRVNKIQNGRHVNKGKMHKITISTGPCGKLGSTKWEVQRLEVDNTNV